MPKRKRPPDLLERTISMGLNRNLLVPSLLPHIEDLVQNVSRRTHRASLLINHFLLDRINKPDFDNVAKCLKDQMFYYAALSLSRSKNHSTFIDFYVTNRDLYENINSLSGSGASLNAAARQMVTNVSNYLWMTFDCRLDRLLKDFDKQDRKIIIDRIRGRDSWKPWVLNEWETELVQHCRSILSTDEIITDEWILEHPGPVLRLFHLILRYCEDTDVKRFTMAPVFQMKSHFVTIDAATLRSLLVKAQELPSKCSQKDFNLLKDDHFRSVFKLRESVELGNEVKTDGVSLRVNTWRKHLDSVSKARLPKKQQTGEKVVENDSEEEEDDMTTLLLPGDDTDYFSNDPGEKNQAFVHHTVEGRVVKKTRLTAKQFRQESHRARHLKTTKKWLKDIERETTVLSRFPLKTSSLEVFKQHLEKKIPMYGRLWEYGLHPRMAKQRWDYKMHCSSCIDRFWSKLAYDNPAGLPLHRRPLLKYGSGNWGHGSAPNKKMFLSARNYFRVVLVPEFRTTVCCSDCGERLKPVRQKFIGPLPEGKNPYSRTIRDLKFCSSNACRSCPLKSRDGNAATNIGYAYPDRPEYLCRNS